LKTLDSGFRRNDVKKNEINFFTPSGKGRVGVILGFFPQLRGGAGWGEDFTGGEILSR